MITEEINGKDKESLEHTFEQYKLRYGSYPQMEQIVINESVYEKRQGKWFRVGPYITPLKIK